MALAHLTLIVALLASSLCAQKDWVERGCVQRTGYFPGGLKGEKQAPIVFVANGAKSLLALDLETGKKKWSYDMGSWCQSDPIVSRGVLYIGSSSGHLHAVRASSGKPIFKKKLGKDGYYFDGGAAAVAGGILYVGLAKNTTRSARDMKGRYVAIQLKTGRLLWSFDAKGRFMGHTISGGRIYATCQDEHVYALDMASGHKDWAVELDSPYPSAPLFHAGTLYVAAGDTVFALDIKKGKTRWKKTLAGNQHLSLPSVSGDHLLVGDRGLYCLRLKDGGVVWSHDKLLVRGAPTVVSNRVFVGNMVDEGPCLFAFDARTGKKLWETDAVNDVVSCHAVAHDILCIVSRLQNELFAFDAKTGKKRWSYALGDQSLSAPCIVD